MKKETVIQLHRGFEQVVNTDPESGVEYWRARDLQGLLGYANWQNFSQVIARAITACGNSGQHSEDHFIATSKMVDVGSNAQRAIDDVMMTRYACYLVAQNGDPSKEPIAFAQTYFAVQTRKMEMIEQRLAEVERLRARQKLAKSEKELSGIIFERLRDEGSFARIRSRGDQALFGGRTTQDMKDRLGVPKNRALADFLPTITIKAKDFANEITNFNVKKNDLKTEPAITGEHVQSSTTVRGALRQRGITPESLPPAEDAKKVERRVESEPKKLPGRAGKPDTAAGPQADA
ncbi:MAG: DNA damage-inducible protein D [Planctomycetota bacterium]|nr:DNA damage-inducible protein D [Planctomycetota bacterium]